MRSPQAKIDFFLSVKMWGYKILDKDFRCRQQQYAVGGTAYMSARDVAVCQSGFHFCVRPVDCLRYYPLEGSRFAEVEATGAVETRGDKSVTNALRIVRELSQAEFSRLCTGTIVINGANRKQLVTYLRGQVHGKVKTWDCFHNLIENAHYRDGVLDGYSITYHANSCYPKTDVEYVKGLKQGSECWYQFGKCVLKITYVSGVRHGPTWTYSKDSVTVEDWVDGLPVGPRWTYEN